MNAQDQARKLCERAAASRDPDDLAEILAELRALMRQHFAHVEELIEERRHRKTGEQAREERVKADFQYCEDSRQLRTCLYSSVAKP